MCLLIVKWLANFVHVVELLLGNRKDSLETQQQLANSFCDGVFLGGETYLTDPNSCSQVAAIQISRTKNLHEG